jgi:hypothetical protein
MRRALTRHALPAAPVAALALALAGTSVAADIGVSVAPSRLMLAGSDAQTLTVRNAGDRTALVGVRVAAFGMTPDGRVVVDPPGDPSRSARTWVTVSPASALLEPGGAVTLRVVSRVPRLAMPGDHRALVLLSTEPPGGTPGRVRVRTQVGVGTVVRVAGVLRRDLRVPRPAAGRAGGRRAVRVRVENRGNVYERFDRGRITVRLVRGRRTVAVLTSRARGVLPGAVARVTLPVPARVRGPVRAIATVRPAPAAAAGPGAGIAATPRVIVRTAALRL